MWKISSMQHLCIFAQYFLHAFLHCLCTRMLGWHLCETLCLFSPCKTSSGFLRDLFWPFYRMFAGSSYVLENMLFQGVFFRIFLLYQNHFEELLKDLGRIWTPYRISAKELWQRFLYDLCTRPVYIFRIFEDAFHKGSGCSSQSLMISARTFGARSIRRISKIRPQNSKFCAHNILKVQWQPWPQIGAPRPQSTAPTMKLVPQSAAPGSKRSLLIVRGSYWRYTFKCNMSSRCEPRSI